MNLEALPPSSSIVEDYSSTRRPTEIPEEPKKGRSRESPSYGFSKLIWMLFRNFTGLPPLVAGLKFQRAASASNRSS